MIQYGYEFAATREHTIGLIPIATAALKNVRKASSVGVSFLATTTRLLVAFSWRRKIATGMYSTPSAFISASSARVAGSPNVVGGLKVNMLTPRITLEGMGLVPGAVCAVTTTPKVTTPTITSIIIVVVVVVVIVMLAIQKRPDCVHQVVYR